eukprot:CAMPEP_0184023194 /NCGR_PEP_ID=MMETSP0954-20121128/11186_1 /TAXON_ID=627963 /ORGANISM="Aplanochytrium sp, Strain PBS07" /LENGTH=337 /DNA_ID=CAMNT_0026305973 /DNA_START=109 /DNA_END=1122 /DNA_ORIENTATION=-
MGAFGKTLKQIASLGSRKEVPASTVDLYRLAAASLGSHRGQASALKDCISEDEISQYLSSSEKLSLSDGYRIQAEVEKYLIDKHGWKKSGFKVGATSKAVQSRLGISTPFFGAIFQENLSLQDFGGDCLSCDLEIDGANQSQWCSFGNISLAQHNCRGIEAEFAFILKKDIELREKDYSWEEVLDHIAEVVPCIEICGSRYAVPIPPGNAPLVIADGAGNSAFLVCDANAKGHVCQDWVKNQSSDMNVTTTINLQQVIEGSGREVLDHPIHSLTWLANALNQEYLHMSDEEQYPWRKLQAKDIVATGATSGLMAVAADSEVVVDFQSFGAIEIITRQ